MQRGQLIPTKKSGGTEHPLPGGKKNATSLPKTVHDTHVINHSGERVKPLAQQRRASGPTGVRNDRGRTSSLRGNRLLRGGFFGTMWISRRAIIKKKKKKKSPRGGRKNKKMSPSQPDPGQLLQKILHQRGGAWGFHVFTQKSSGLEEGKEKDTKRRKSLPGTMSRTCWS